MADSFDVAVLGGGPGGYVAAIRAAQLGKKAACIEAEALGGVCLNWGCIPTKTMIATASMYKKIRNASRYGLKLDGNVSVDMEAMMARKDKIVKGLVDGIDDLFDFHGVTSIKGRGRLKSENALIVEQEDGSKREIRSENIIIATGSRPLNIPAFPYDGEYIISSNEMVALKKIPESLLIIGMGVIGCEFAFLMSMLGCRVTMVELLEHALPLEDIDVSKTIERELKKNKVKFHLGRKVTVVDVHKGEGIRAELDDGRTIEAERALVSIGRKFNVDDIGLEELEIEKNDNGSIKTNLRMQTNIPNIYAIGDVAGKWLLAYTASAEGVVAAANCAGEKTEINYAGVPNAIFTTPEVGSVGLREKQAEEQGINVRTGQFLFRVLGKAQAENEIEGLVKVVADADSDKILGVHIVGAHATELIHECALAVRMELTVEQLGNAFHAHPVMSEAILEAVHDVHGLSIHNPKQL
ncbi:MAG TPA: dihydrolipoyl dehydrogenase [candidate division Zixibacteria bacterium]|nr:dihydrolipoyl dehydrogenase [candidate division Zixibacteria bacterium]